MADWKLRETGEILTLKEINARFPHRGKGKNWPEAVADKIEVGEVPLAGKRQKAVKTTPSLGEDGKLYWQYELVSTVPTDPTELAAYLAREKIALKDQVAAKRYEKEIGGVTVGGLTIDTDDRSKTLISGAYNLTQANPSRTTYDLKGVGGFTETDRDTVIAIATAMGEFVQECFTREKELCAAIDNKNVDTIAKLDAIDIEAGWPT